MLHCSRKDWRGGLIVQYVIVHVGVCKVEYRLTLSIGQSGFENIFQHMPSFFQGLRFTRIDIFSFVVT